MPDEPEAPDLRPAATNPWYVLMTVAGEQTELVEIDPGLHARNRRYWNGFQAEALNAETKAELIKNSRATQSDLASLSEAEKDDIATALKKRCPDTERPEPGALVDLGQCAVDYHLICSSFVFPGGAYFSDATFSGEADFTDATFSGDAYFYLATFSGNAYFENATFSGDAFFASVTFSGVITLASTTFFGVAEFEEATFFAHVVSDSATFSEDAVFANATFSEGAVFSDATFSGLAFFESATFSGGAVFESATFSGHANFAGATFSGDAAFAGATFSRGAAFSDVMFKLATSFGPTRHAAGFRPVRFAREPPEFFGATLHEDTDFTDVDWPKVPDDVDPEKRRDRAIRHRRAYERLKLLMNSQSRVADELIFQRLELRCREAEAVGDWRSREWWVARASRLFGVLSDYGWDPVRPVIWLGGLLAAGWALIFVAEIIAWLWLDWPDPQRPPEYLGFWQAGALSFSNLFGFLGLNRTFLREEIATLTALAEVVSALQTIAGLILPFLLGLAMRNRFRIK